MGLGARVTGDGGGGGAGDLWRQRARGFVEAAERWSGGVEMATRRPVHMRASVRRGSG